MKREPGIALKDALRFWGGDDGHFDPQEWAARLQEWAARFLADQRLPSAKDRGGFHRDANTGEEITIRGRKVPIPDTDENALHSVEARFDYNSGQHWAARIKRLGQTEGLALVAHLSAIAIAAAEKESARQQRVDAAKAPRDSFEGSVLPGLVQRARERPKVWRSKAEFARDVRRIAIEDRDECLAAGRDPGPEVPEWKDIARQIRRLETGK